MKPIRLFAVAFVIWLLPVAFILVYWAFSKPAFNSPKDPKLEQIQEKNPMPIWNCESTVRPCEDIWSIEEDEFQFRSPFHQGRGPLRYEVGSKSSWGSSRPIFYGYKDFITFYIYKGSDLVGAQTYKPYSSLELNNLQKGLLAESHYCHIGPRTKNNAEVEEFHYDESGKLSFYCKSYINGIGLKIMEEEAVGKKDREYYAYWPY